MASAIAGPAAAALASLAPEQVKFIRDLPKAELHAHLNGSIPLDVLKDLAHEYALQKSGQDGSLSNDVVQSGIKVLLHGDGPSLQKIEDFFGLFPAIYALTSTPATLARVTHAVLSSFLDGEQPQCTYLELRSTPRESPHMTREVYIRTVLGELAQYGADQAGLIVSLDRRMSQEVLRECLDIAKKLKAEGERVVGVDLCGDPLAGDMTTFKIYFDEARSAGLGVTLHIAEVRAFHVYISGMLKCMGLRSDDREFARGDLTVTFIPPRSSWTRDIP
jgi:adenosine deaminase